MSHLQHFDAFESALAKGSPAADDCKRRRVPARATQLTTARRAFTASSTHRPRARSQHTRARAQSTATMLVYDHTQRSKALAIFLMMGYLVMCAVAIALRETAAPCDDEARSEHQCRDGPLWVTVVILGVVGAILALLSASFQQLRVTLDDADVLRFRFGPLPLLNACMCGKGEVRLDSVERIETARPSCMWGFGVRFLPSRIMFRLHGLSVVHLHMKAGSGLDVMVGTDEPDQLATVLHGRLSDRGHGGASLLPPGGGSAMSYA